MNPLSLFGQTSNDIYAVDMSNIATDGIILAVLTFIIGVIIVVYAIVAYLLSRIFKKAGVAGWKAWVPVYNTWITLELGRQPGWISLFLLSPLVVNLLPQIPDYEAATIILVTIAFVASMVATVFLYIAMFKIGLHFGKDEYFVLWAIFLPIVWYAWLAFDQSAWKDSVIEAKFSPTIKESSDSQPPTSAV